MTNKLEELKKEMEEAQAAAKVAAASAFEAAGLANAACYAYYKELNKNNDK